MIEQENQVVTKALTVKEVIPIIQKLEVNNSKVSYDYATWQRLNDKDHGEIYQFDQRHHWMSYLWGIKNQDRDFLEVINSIKCAPMLLWLIETLGIDFNVDEFIEENENLTVDSEIKRKSYSLMCQESKILKAKYVNNEAITDCIIRGLCKKRVV